jgi:hypothetical protein
MTYSAGGLMMITLFVFTTVGSFLQPLAIELARNFLLFVRGG